MTKVIFLDVDGVLNSWDTKTRNPLGYIGVDQIYCQRLRDIVAATGAKVVLSSAWRHTPSALPYLWDACGPTVECIGETQYFPSRQRGDEIASWLTEHPCVDRFVILDDREDMSSVQDHLVHTDESVGLTEENKKQAIEKLNS